MHDAISANSLQMPQCDCINCQDVRKYAKREQEYQEWASKVRKFPFVVRVVPRLPRPTARGYRSA